MVVVCPTNKTGSLPGGKVLEDIDVSDGAPVEVLVSDGVLVEVLVSDGCVMVEDVVSCSGQSG